MLRELLMPGPPHGERSGSKQREHQADKDRPERDQHKRQHRAETLVGGAEELIVDGVGDEILRAAAKDRGDCEIGQRKRQHHHAGADEARTSEWQHDVDERANPVRAERSSGCLQLFGNGGECRREHQNGKGQHILDEAEQHGGIVVDEPHRGDPDKAKRLVHHALVAEDDQPAIGTHHLADEERQEQRDQQEFAQSWRTRAHHQIGVGKGEDQRHRGDDQGCNEAALRDNQEQWLGQRTAEIGDGIVVGELERGGVERAQAGIRDLDQTKHQQPDKQHRRKQHQIGRSAPEPRRPDSGGNAFQRIHDAPFEGIGCAGCPHENPYPTS